MKVNSFFLWIAISLTWLFLAKGDDNFVTTSSSFATLNDENGENTVVFQRTTGIPTRTADIEETLSTGPSSAKWTDPSAILPQEKAQCKAKYPLDYDNKYKGWPANVSYLFPPIPIAAPFSQDEKCRADSRLLIDGLYTNRLWAMRMWDASAKTSDGAILGTMIQAGSFDSCLVITEPIKSQYCIASYTMKVSPNYSDSDSAFTYMRDRGEDPMFTPRDVIQWGLCFPASCSPEEMTIAINQYLKTSSKPNQTDYEVTVLPSSCFVAGESEPYEPMEIAFWATCGTIVIVCLACSIFDTGKPPEKGNKCQKIVQCFSIPRNFGKLITFEEKKGHFPTSALHGLKVFSIWGVVLAHKSLSLSYWLVSEEYFVELKTKSPTFAIWAQIDLVVDTFFFISGFLVIFYVLPLYKKTFINPILLVIVRIVRLAPALYFLLWFHTYALHRLGDGPFWKLILEKDMNFCKQNGWTNMLFIHNYLRAEGMCLLHTWYVACDLQLFIIAVTILVIMHRSERLGLFVLTLLLGFSFVVPGLIQYYGELELLKMHTRSFMTDPRHNRPFGKLYISTPSRSGVYLVGMLGGYIMLKMQKSKKKLSITWIILGIIATLLCMVGPIFLGKIYLDQREVKQGMDKVYATIYVATRRHLWGVGIFIMLMLYALRPSNMISSIFESRPILFLSRLTYGIYLLHSSIIFARTFKLRSPKPFSSFDGWMDGLSDFVLSTLFAIVVQTCFSAPIENVLQMLLVREKPVSVKPTPVSNESSTNGNTLDVPDKY